MEKRFKGIQILPVITMSLFILALPAYLHCARPSQTKFVSSDLSFENPDQKEGLPDNEKEWKGFGPSTLFMMFLLGGIRFERSSYLFSQVLSLRQRIVVLRC
jgi:hypothetical protein